MDEDDGWSVQQNREKAWEDEEFDSGCGGEEDATALEP